MFSFSIFKTYKWFILLMERCNSSRLGVFPVAKPVISVISLESSIRMQILGKVIEGKVFNALNLRSSSFSVGSVEVLNVYKFVILFLFKWSFSRDCRWTGLISVILFSLMFKFLSISRCYIGIPFILTSSFLWINKSSKLGNSPLKNSSILLCERLRVLSLGNWDMTRDYMEVSWFP